MHRQKRINLEHQQEPLQKMHRPKKLDEKPYLTQIMYTSFINHDILSQIKQPDNEHILVFFSVQKVLFKMFSHCQNTFSLYNNIHAEICLQSIFSHCQREMNKTSNLCFSKRVIGKSCLAIIRSSSSSSSSSRSSSSSSTF